ncbi:MAG: AsnC family transcriptional regulator, partial [Candidatus Wukongarchaeota archaeon]|nr:AsnC family transcriptional regulator [Candidatus Wukongarchaeota archaeon]
MAKTDDVIVDETDRAIVRELLKNARKTYKEIGEIIGYTTMGAKKRVDKLLENKLITTTILTNVKEFKLNLALVFLEVRNAEKLREIFVKFEKCPSVIYVFKTLGKYNLIALISAEDEDTLESVIARNFSIRTQEGVWSSEFYPICGIFYSPFLPMRKDACQKA